MHLFLIAENCQIEAIIDDLKQMVSVPRYPLD